jgi:hypothetical protein
MILPYFPPRNRPNAKNASCEPGYFACKNGKNDKKSPDPAQLQEGNCL